MLRSKEYVVIQKVGFDSSALNKKNTNLSFSGNLYELKSDKLTKVLSESSNFQEALKIFRQMVKERVRLSTDVFVKAMPESENPKYIPVEGGFMRENVQLLFIDDKTGKHGAVGFYMNPKRDAKTLAQDLWNTISYVAQDSLYLKYRKVGNI